MASGILEIGFDVVRFRAPGRGRRIVLEREPYEPETRPFLKWAGGKQWLVPIVDAFLPATFSGRYYEPFLGGGSVFLGLAPDRATLSDANPDLIAAYRGLRDQPEKVVSLLASFPHDREFFERLRDAKPRADSRRAARLIYLNKTAFNGLYRVSRHGRFNVPFGDYTNPTICNDRRLQAAASALSGASLVAAPFTRVLNRACRGDVVYLDPPYVTTHNENGFLKYNAKLFSWADQVRLSRKALLLKKKKVRVVVSNADHPSVIGLYPGFYCYRVERRSAIGGGLDYRGRVSELLFTSFPLFGISAPTLR